MWTPSFLHFRYIWIHKLINHKSIPKKIWLVRLSASHKLQHHYGTMDFAGASGGPGRGPPQLSLEARLSDCSWLFTCFRFHFSTSLQLQTPRLRLYGWSCLTWALFTPSQKVFGAWPCAWEDRVTDGQWRCLMNLIKKEQEITTAVGGFIKQRYPWKRRTSSLRKLRICLDENDESSQGMEKNRREQSWTAATLQYCAAEGCKHDKHW